MRNGICVFGFILLFSNGFLRGQNVPKPFCSDFLISEGIKLHDKELYDSARVYFHQIMRNDSLYGTACYEIALGYYEEKDYDSALVYIKRAVNSKQTGLIEQARTLMGSIFDDAGMPDSAIVCYQTALKLRPYSPGIWYDLGITYYQMDSLDLAEQCLIQAITLNPAYFKANYALGHLNEKKNRRVEALLCYYMADLINHSADLAREIELYLGGESEIKPLLQQYYPTNLSFEKLEDYINSKIAMAAKYKPVFKSQAAFVRQGDLLFKYLEYNPKDNNFYMNYYVRLFTFMRNKKYMETCMYAYFSVFNSENVQKWLKSNASKVQKFYKAMSDEIYRLATRGLVNDANYEGVNYVYYEGTLLEFGKYSNEKNKIKEGMWTFVERDGSISTTLNYTNGKPEGEMKNFNSSGQLTANIPFVNGVKSGVGKGYHDNGQLSVEAVFENDKLNGNYTSYFSTGQKQMDGNNKNDMENGLFINYFKNGAISDSISWTNGKQNGVYCAMYPNNQLLVKGRITNDLSEGEYVYYYPDGQPSSQGNYVKNNQVGKEIDYYPNGTISAICFYNDKGNLSDTAKYFDANGLLTYLHIYANSGKNIQKIAYRPDGSIYGKEETKNDNVVKIESFDTDGKSFGEINISNAGTYIQYYNMFGTIATEGMIKNGKDDGRWISYGLFGNIERISYFQKGERNGTDTTFFSNGTINTIENYKDGKVDGYVTQYNLAGKITAEGYCVDDVKEGYWLFYDNAGNLTQKAYYSNNEPDQWQEFYYSNGNLSQEIYYDNYITREIINYDSTGKEYERLIIPDSACKIIMHYPNGKIMSEVHYIGGVSNGLETHFHANGQKKCSYNSVMGNIFDTIRYYDEDGKHTATVGYMNDKIYGNVITIDEEERSEAKWFNDQTYDTVKWYNNENKLKTTLPYLENEEHGLASYYDAEGELAYQLLYYKGAAVECVSPKDNQRIKIENGKKITTYYANGKKSAEMTFLNGNRAGEYIRYYANGKPCFKYNNEAGTYNGTYSEHYSDGNLKEEGNYIYGDQDGVVKKYHPNGKLKEETFYVYGKKHGEQKSYNQHGALVKKTMYYYGEIVE